MAEVRRGRGHLSRWRRYGGLLVAAVGVLALTAPTRAEAHGTSGAIQLVESRASGELELSIQVCIAYADDHQADPADVSVRAQGPEALEVAAKPMEVDSAEGLRSGTLVFPEPGSWTVIVESTNPPASLAVPVTIGVGDPISVAQVASIGGSAGAACLPPSSDAPTWLVFAGSSVAAIVVFGGLLLLMRRGGPAANGSA